jgi:hypothetical protein
MANGDEIAGGPQGADAGAAGAAPPSPAPAPGNAPGGGGPVLAALARRQQGPQPSAPGPGDQASSLTMLQNALGMMQSALSGLQPGTPVHRDVLRALQSLSRHMAQGQPTVGVQQTQLQDMLRGLLRNALLSKVMGQQGQQGGPGGPAGAMPQAPMPSTPLPGA